MTLPLPSQIFAAVSLRLAALEAWFTRNGWDRSLGGFLRGGSYVAAAFVGSRLVIFGIILFSKMIMVHAAWWHAGGLSSVLTQWDGELWYIQIARHGYHIAGDHLPHPFFPVYPLLIKLVSIFFRDLRAAALVSSNASLLIGGLLLNALIRIDYKDPRVSRAAIALFMFNPVSFFYSSAYSESAFFMFATGALFAARKGRWLAASLCGMFLSASRSPGVLIAIPVVIEYLRQSWAAEAGIRSIVNRHVLSLALIPSGLGAYMLYEWVAFNDPLAFSHSAKVFGRAFVSPLQTIGFLQSYTTFYYVLFLGTLIVALAILVTGMLLKVRASYLAYAACLTALYLCSATFEAFPRYVSVEVPLYVILGLLGWRFRWTYEPIFAASCTLLALLTVLFANGYWIT